MTRPTPKKRTRNTLPPSIIWKIAGLVFLTAATIITLAIRCPTKPQYFIIYTLVGLSLSFLLYRNARQAKLVYKLLNIGFRVTGGLALIFGLYYTNPIDRFHPNNCEMPVSVSVFVHGKKGRQDMILRQQGYVIMDILSERKRESINEKGQAAFQNLHIGDKVLLNIDFSEPYKAIYPDSVHVITEDGRIYLPVALEGINKVQGMVIYNEKPLPGVIVKIDRLIDTSNETGNYYISIPDSLQSKEYQVQFYKPDYKGKVVTAYPQTGQPLNIILEK